MTGKYDDTPYEDRPAYTYEVRTPDGMETIQAKTMRTVWGCLGFAADGTGWIRLFARGAWVSVVRGELHANTPEAPAGVKLPGVVGTGGARVTDISMVKRDVREQDLRRAMKEAARTVELSPGSLDKFVWATWERLVDMPKGEEGGA